MCKIGVGGLRCQSYVAGLQIDTASLSRDLFC